MDIDASVTGSDALAGSLTARRGAEDDGGEWLRRPPPPRLRRTAVDDAGVEEIVITVATPKRASGTSTPRRGGHGASALAARRAGVTLTRRRRRVKTRMGRSTPSRAPLRMRISARGREGGRLIPLQVLVLIPARHPKRNCDAYNDANANAHAAPARGKDDGGSARSGSTARGRRTARQWRGSFLEVST